jgi:hypothetical protein
MLQPIMAGEDRVTCELRSLAGREVPHQATCPIDEITVAVIGAGNYNRALVEVIGSSSAVGTGFIDPPTSGTCDVSSHPVYIAQNHSRVYMHCPRGSHSLRWCAASAVVEVTEVASVGDVLTNELHNTIDVYAVSHNPASLVNMYTYLTVLLVSFFFGRTVGTGTGILVLLFSLIYAANAQDAGWNHYAVVWDPEMFGLKIGVLESYKMGTHYSVTLVDLLGLPVVTELDHGNNVVYYADTNDTYHSIVERGPAHWIHEKDDDFSTECDDVPSWESTDRPIVLPPHTGRHCFTCSHAELSMRTRYSKASGSPVANEIYVLQLIGDACAMRKSCEPGWDMDEYMDRPGLTTKSFVLDAARVGGKVITTRGVALNARSCPCSRRYAKTKGFDMYGLFKTYSKYSADLTRGHIIPCAFGGYTYAANIWPRLRDFEKEENKAENAVVGAVKGKATASISRHMIYQCKNHRNMLITGPEAFMDVCCFLLTGANECRRLTHVINDEQTPLERYFEFSELKGPDYRFTWSIKHPDQRETNGHRDILQNTIECSHFLGLKEEL